MKGILIGLTGFTGAGKNAVAARMARLGAVVIDADILAREALLPGSESVAKIHAAFGDSVMLAKGIVNRGKLSELVFSDASSLEALNAIMLPCLRVEMLKRANNAFRLENAGIVVLNAPLLAEAGLLNDIDELWVVTAPASIRANRLTARDRMSKEAVLSRINARSGEGELIKRADVVINNFGTADMLNKEVDRIFTERYLKP